MFDCICYISTLIIFWKLMIFCLVDFNWNRVCVCIFIVVLHVIWLYMIFWYIPKNTLIFFLVRTKVFNLHIQLFALLIRVDLFWSECDATGYGRLAGVHRDMHHCDRRSEPTNNNRKWTAYYCERSISMYILMCTCITKSTCRNGAQKKEKLLNETQPYCNWWANICMHFDELNLF